MSNRGALTRQTPGFTIVELLIVIVIIGILAAIVTAAYNGIQRSAIISSARSDLNNVVKVMELSKVKTGAYPDLIPPDAKASPGITLRLVKHTGGYSGLTSVQNGVLFHNICQQLITEGYGTATNLGGGTEQYLTGCHVYNYNQLHINGWHSQHFSVSIAQTDIYNWYNANVSNNAWSINKKASLLEFASELSTRFLALGGSFPVVSFWDNWANSNNGGVQQQPLAAPRAPSDPSTFCIEASHISHTDILYHVDQSNPSKEGACP